PGETLLGRGFLIAPGGKGANQAVAASRLGARTVMIGRVGDDIFGTEMLAHLNSDGVNTSSVTVEVGMPTGVALITLEDSGENTIVVASGANMKVGPGDVEAVRREMVSAKVVLLQLEIPMEPLTAAAKAAQEHGVTVVLDPAPAQDLPADLYSAVDILTPNESEAARLVGFPLSSNKAIEQAARILLARGVRNVLIKLGGRGAYRADSSGGEFRPAPEVELIDTVAAGDAFNGGLAAALSEGHGYNTAISWALAAGALAVTKSGAQPSLPHRRALLDLLARATS
ncbi:MAG: ribokinase, partial [Chloroflexota bacterium]|nr:ribokinase [Chloroflexota bacterium]